ncbi:10636_t:CDS:2 [Ambispora gerdemannii]|uniref:10636_t:CDS:1 n=1 Tax=Ambispora gerdemannii TaxID=144530 RepID=A0A9N9CRI8_9GLOM|nr:10636_t:CDS:2 [Ambispora gerdemannii]
MSDSNPLSILKGEINRLGFVSGEKISLLSHFTENVQKIAVAVSCLDDFDTDKDKRTYLRSLISPPDPLFTNILDVVLNLRKTLPESLRDDIETMSEEQEIEQEELTSNLIQHPNRKPLAVIKEPVLYVRESYRDLYHIVTNENDEDCDLKFLITGTSGVGKSCFLIYLLIRLLCNKTDATVIFKPASGNLLYCFKDSNLSVGDSEEFSEQLYNSKTWYLVDGTVPEDVIAKTVVSASSKSIKDNRFQDFVKNLVSVFCVPPWSLEELEACRLSVFPMIPQDLMLDLSDEAGGVPRYVLRIPASIIRLKNPNLEDQDMINMIKQISLKRVKEALLEISDIRKLVQCFSENAQYVEFSSRLIHRWPDTFYQERSLSWASGRIFDKIQKKLEDSRWGNLFLKIQDPDDPSSSRGIMFESHVLHLFKLGGQTFESRRLRENENDPVIYDELTIPTKPTTMYIRYASQLTRHNQEGIIIKPTIRNFGAIDLILTPYCIFQITVSPKHPVKQSELINVVQNMPAYKKNPKAKIFLCFIVPDDIYDAFSYQRYITPKKKIGNDLEAFQAVKRMSPIFSNVEQWVVKIKMTPEMTVTSVLNNAMAVANSCL